MKQGCDGQLGHQGKGMTFQALRISIAGGNSGSAYQLGTQALVPEWNFRWHGSDNDGQKWRRVSPSTSEIQGPGGGKVCRPCGAPAVYPVILVCLFNKYVKDSASTHAFVVDVEEHVEFGT